MNDTSEHNGGEVVLYESSDGEVRLDVRLESESIWLTQRQMAELFGRERSVIARHVPRALAHDELSPESNVQKGGIHFAPPTTTCSNQGRLQRWSDWEQDGSGQAAQGAGGTGGREREERPLSRNVNSWG